MNVFIRLSGALIAAVILSVAPTRALAQVYIGIGSPPALPAYDQPLLDQPNQIWQPGYWAWGPAGYYWVPGMWVTPPQTNMYWTPGYWSYLNNGYEWNQGYWAPQVGYYGGINYGSGYYGNGYVGGTWQNNVFRYNTAVSRVNTRVVHYVYVDRTVVVTHVVRTSYNGGPHGIHVRPTPTQLAVLKLHRIPMTQVQRAHAVEAERNRNNLRAVNHGNPAHAAVVRPLNASNRPANFKPVTNADRQPTHAKASSHNEQAHAAAQHPPAQHSQSHQAPPKSKPPQNGKSQSNGKADDKGKPPR
jgi:WXXGXW repeat (2 copies)